MYCRHLKTQDLEKFLLEVDRLPSLVGLEITSYIAETPYQPVDFGASLGTVGFALFERLEFLWLPTVIWNDGSLANVKLPRAKEAWFVVNMGPLDSVTEFLTNCSHLHSLKLSDYFLGAAIVNAVLCGTRAWPQDSCKLHLHLSALGDDFAEAILVLAEIRPLSRLELRCKQAEVKALRVAVRSLEGRVPEILVGIFEQGHSALHGVRFVSFQKATDKHFGVFLDELEFGSFVNRLV